MYPPFVSELNVTVAVVGFTNCTVAVAYGPVQQLRPPAFPTFKVNIVSAEALLIPKVNASATASVSPQKTLGLNIASLPLVPSQPRLCIQHQVVRFDLARGVPACAAARNLLNSFN